MSRTNPDNGYAVMARPVGDDLYYYWVAPNPAFTGWYRASTALEHDIGPLVTVSVSK